MGEEAAVVLVEAPRPRSPPRYPDMCGRRRMQLEVQILDREITFLKVSPALSPLTRVKATRTAWRVPLAARYLLPLHCSFSVSHPFDFAGFRFLKLGEIRFVVAQPRESGICRTRTR
jgi:hypothetical protein